MGLKLPRRSTLAGVETYRADIPATLIAGTLDQPVYQNDSKVKEIVKEVRVIPQADMTGNDTNNALIGVVNKELDGTGTVVVCAQKEYDTGTDLSEFDADDIPVSATAADVEIQPGEVLAISITKTASGLVTPKMVIEIDVEKAGQ